MSDFKGPPRPLPRPLLRNYSPYEASRPVETERVVHAEGYEEVARDMPGLNTPVDFAAWVDGKDLPTYGLAIYCGNWLIAYRGAGYWVHVVVGRPEVYVAGLGRVDMISVADDLLRGNGRVFRHISGV